MERKQTRPKMMPQSEYDNLMTNGTRAEILQALERFVARKAGRPPLGPAALSAKERKERWRQNHPSQTKLAEESSPPQP